MKKSAQLTNYQLNSLFYFSSEQSIFFQASRWEWRHLNPCNSPYQPIPCPRIGHSFNLVGNKAFMFGGLAQNKIETQPRYSISFNFLNSWEDRKEKAY